MSNSIAIQFSYGEAGQGVYGELLSAQQHAVIDFFKDRLLRTVDSIPFCSKDTSTPFTIGDFGAADGSVSMPLITQLIEVIRKKHGEVPIQVLYEDQAANDFNSVFRRIHGLIPKPPTYLKRFDQVYAMASGTGFFQQVMPDNTAHLIVSFNAAQYLSELPTKFQNSLHRFPDATEEECRLVETQAAKDWETFLLRRAKELKSGGVLVVTAPSHDPEMKIDAVSHSMQAVEEGLVNIWRQFRDEGKITQEEFVDTNFQRCTRYLRELTAPLEDQGSAVYRAGLELFHAETFLTPCVSRRQWQQTLDEEGVDDRASWAKAVVNHHRPWSNNLFFQFLSDTRSQYEKEVLLKELYCRLEKDILDQGPEQCKTSYLMNVVFIRKM